MFSKVAVLFAFAACVAYTSATAVQTCGGTKPNPVSVEIVGCEKEPCPLVTGSSALMDIKFKSPIYTNTLKPKVRATVGPLTINYPMPGDRQDACLSLLDGFCPIDEGETITYHLDFPIAGFPHIDVLLEFSLIGDDETVFQCFKVNCKVVGGKKYQIVL